MTERDLYYGSAQERMRDPGDDSTTHKLKNAYWTTKQVVIRKFGRREDEHVVASDSELDAKLELFQSIQKTCMDLMRIIERYQDKICMLSQAENELGRFLKNQGAEDKTRAGKMMSAVGKSLSFSAQQRLALRVPLSRLQQEVETFRYRAISDTLQTVSTMEQRRTEYRAALLWMRDASEQLDPDTYKQLDKFRKVQAQVRKTKGKFDKFKLDSMQKVDLLAASRCNMFSHVLSLYQSTLLQFWEKTCRTMVAVADSFQGYQYYEFSMLKDLTDESRKLAQLTRQSARALSNGDDQQQQQPPEHGEGPPNHDGHGDSAKEELDALDKRLEDIFAAGDDFRDEDTEGAIKAAMAGNSCHGNIGKGAMTTAANQVRSGKSAMTTGLGTGGDARQQSSADILGLGFHGNESEQEAAADKAFLDELLTPTSGGGVYGDRPMSIFDDFIGQHGGDGGASLQIGTARPDEAIASRPDWNSLFGGSDSAGCVAGGADSASLLDLGGGGGPGVIGNASLATGRGSSPAGSGAPPSQLLAGIMPSALLDHRAQLATLFDPLGSGGGGSDTGKGQSVSMTTAAAAAARSGKMPQGGGGIGGGSSSTTAAWISMFADLDPLANPDAISKKEGQITDT